MNEDKFISFDSSVQAEKNFLYHGSISADITEIKTYSMLHGTDKKVAANGPNSQNEEWHEFMLSGNCTGS